MIRLASGDPGKEKSRFAILIADVYPKEIQIRGAKEYRKFDYTLVEDDIARLHMEHKFRQFVVELNNTGKHVVDNMKRYHPHVQLWPVNTVGKPVTDPDKVREGHSMYKKGTAEYVKKLKDDGIIKFPRQSTPVLEELKRQMEGFLPYVTPTGSITYHSEGMQRDDLVMALLLLCFRAEVFMNSSQEPVVAGIGSDEDYWQSLKSDKDRLLAKPRMQERMKSLQDLSITDVKIS